MIRTACALALFAGLAFPLAARAEMKQFHATLNAATEVPPKNSSGTGSFTAALDTASDELTYTLTFENLTGPATMAHIHGPAAPGKNAGVLVPFPHPVSPVAGTVKLTPAEITDIEAGNTYVNVHTAANPGGEIRGQVMPGS